MACEQGRLPRRAFDSATLREMGAASPPARYAWAASSDDHPIPRLQKGDGMSSETGSRCAAGASALVLILATLSPAEAQVAGFEWLEQFGSPQGPALDSVNAIARDADGNVYVAGQTG